MKRITTLLFVSTVLTVTAYGQKGGTPLIDQCRKQAQPTWAKGGRGNTYEGNDIYRSCLKDQINQIAKTVIPADQLSRFQTDMQTADDKITDVYNDLSDVLEKAGHRRALDEAADASDLSYYEDLLQAMSLAADALKQKG